MGLSTVLVRVLFRTTSRCPNPQLPSRGQTVDLQWTGPTLDEAASGRADVQFSSEEARERLQPRTVYPASTVPPF